MGTGARARRRSGRSRGGANRSRISGPGAERTAGIETREATMKTHRLDHTTKLGRMTSAITIVSTMLIAVPAFAHDMSAMGGMEGRDTSAPNAMGSHMAMDA